ncbi:hypothetical protein D3875_00640 [Deinococcus cavernae]|uniref:Site-specific integrase n=1 Tax=Deinococcus cavernae TaxID=2320857 RepID=A0A418VHG9_9DEIO|nr:hypothetical protein [Deinococcus cavernae]RJF75589.1 hypothetical protein D3875_00640 [Deinococcus cavernae]
MKQDLLFESSKLDRTPEMVQAVHEALKLGSLNPEYVDQIWDLAFFHASPWLRWRMRPAYRTALRRFAAFLGETAIEWQQSAVAVLTEFDRWLQGDGMSWNTRRQYLRLVRQLLDDLGDSQGLNLSAAPLARGRSDRQAIRPYGRHEVDMLLSQADHLEQVMVLLAADAALRPGEILALSVEHVQFGAPSRLLVSKLDSKRCDLIPSRRLERALYRHLASYSSADRVVGGSTTAHLKKRLSSLCRRAGVSSKGRGLLGLRLHAACVVWSVESEEAARTFMGITSSSTWRQYQQVRQDFLEIEATETDHRHN